MEHDWNCPAAEDDNAACLCEQLADVRMMNQVLAIYGDMATWMLPTLMECDPLFAKYADQLRAGGLAFFPDQHPQT